MPRPTCCSNWQAATPCCWRPTPPRRCSRPPVPRPFSSAAWPARRAIWPTQQPPISCARCDIRNCGWGWQPTRARETTTRTWFARCWHRPWDGGPRTSALLTRCMAPAGWPSDLPHSPTIRQTQKSPQGECHAGLEGMQRSERCQTRRSELAGRHEGVETRLRKTEPENLVALEVAHIGVNLLPLGALGIVLGEDFHGGLERSFQHGLREGQHLGLGGNKLLECMRIQRIVLGQHVSMGQMRGGLDDGLVLGRQGIECLVVDEEVHFRRSEE